MGRRKKPETEKVVKPSKSTPKDDFESMLGDTADILSSTIRTPAELPAPVPSVLPTATVKHLLELAQIREESLHVPPDPIPYVKTPRRGKPLRAVEQYKSERPLAANKTLAGAKVPSRLRHLKHTPKFKQG